MQRDPGLIVLELLVILSLPFLDCREVCYFVFAAAQRD